MKRKIGRILMEIGAVLMFVALLLFLYNRWQDYRAKEAATEALESLDEAIEENLSGEVTDDAPSDDDASDDEMDTVLIDGYLYIGKISLPRFGLELPVMNEWSYDGMKISPGRYQGTAVNGDLVICGHNYTRHFGHLGSLDEGDEITFTDVNGNEYNYEVLEVITLEPTAIEEMVDDAEDEWDLTLFTCTLGGQARVTVRCRLMEEE